MQSRVWSTRPSRRKRGGRGYCRGGPCGSLEGSAGEFADGGGGECEAAGREQSAVVLASKRQSGGATNVGVSFHEADEVGAWDGLDGAGAEGFCSDVVESVRAQSGEAEDVAGAGDAEQAAIGRHSGDLDAVAADDQELVRRGSLLG